MLAIGIALFLFYLLAKFVRFLNSEYDPLWKEEYMGPKGSYSRRLGHFEEMLVDVGAKGIINLSSIIFVRSKVKITKEKVRKALQELATRHPLLRSCVTKEQGNDYHILKPMDNFHVPLEVISKADWKRLFEDKLCEIYDIEKGPLWKVTFIEQTAYDDGEGRSAEFPYQMAFIFGFHHITTDGTSYSNLFGDFVQNLHDIHIDYDRHELPFDLLPPVEAFLEGPNPKMTFGEKVGRRIAQLIACYPSLLAFLIKKTWKFPLYVQKHGVEIERHPDAIRKTCILPRELTRDQTRRVLAACKKHGTTVHGALMAAASFAYAILSKGDGKHMTEDASFRTVSTINLRPHIDGNIHSHYMGPYFSGTGNDFAKLTPKSTFWEVAATLVGNIRKFLKGNEVLKFTCMLVDLRKAMMELPQFTYPNPDNPSGRTGDLVFTNLGYLRYVDDVNERCDMKITARFGCSAEHQFGHTFANNIATFNGKIFWTFTYYPHVTNEDQAKEFADLTISNLLAHLDD